MIRFDPHDPYPLASPGASHADACAHAAEVDAWLGLRTEATERAISARRADLPADQRLWIDLPVQTLLTPYVELRAMLERIAPRADDRIVDLGAGYGRMGFVVARHAPTARFTGYEYVEERVEEGARALRERGAENARLLRADLAAADFRAPEAEHYFIYDYGTREAIRKTLGELRQLATKRPISVVGRGRATRDAIERDEPWLSQVVAPEHAGNFTVYRSAAR